MSYANDAVGADQLDQRVGGRALGVALGIGLDVAEIANVAGLVGGSTVGLLVRVDWRQRVSTCEARVLQMQKLTVRAGRGAAVGVVTKGVDVEAPLGAGVVAGDVPGDGGRGRLGLLLKGDGARDLGVTTDDADCGEPMLASCPMQCDVMQGARMDQMGALPGHAASHQGPESPSRDSPSRQSSLLEALQHP